jgi:hypothetical protein
VSALEGIDDIVEQRERVAIVEVHLGLGDGHGCVDLVLLLGGLPCLGGVLPDGFEEFLAQPGGFPAPNDPALL